MPHLYQFPYGHVFYRKMGHGRPKISHGQGIYLYDEKGKRYIDGTGGPFVVNIGHGRTEIAQAISKQAQTAAYVHASMFTSNVIEQYASELAKIVPIPDARFFFMTSGSEVVEGAIKLARQIQMARGETERNLIISRDRSYHGMSLGALSTSGRRSLRDPYLEMMLPGIHVDPPYTYRDNRTGKDYATQFEEVILEHGAHKIAAFIAEPISGAALGACTPPDDYWSAIRQICNQYGILLIVDEVLVGMGRTGKWWGIDHWDVVPDILITAKGAAGGYFPLGFIAANGDDVERIHNTLGDFNHGGTFSHHAVGAAAGLATLQIIHEETLIQKSADMGRNLGILLQSALANHPHIGDIRGRGLFWGIEFVQDKTTKTPFPAKRELAQEIWQQAFDLGLSLYYSQGCANGTDGDVIMVGPPMIVQAAELKEIVDLLQKAIGKTID